MAYKIYNNDCLNQLNLLEENSIDSIVTDPPYELNFMGKGWDNAGISFNKETWKKCLRVLKPGGYLLAFGGSRTYHRIACAIEDAGFEIRDTIMYLYGSGFPKSMDISKSLDKRNGRNPNIKFKNYLNEKRKEKGYSLADINKLMNVATNGGGFASGIMGEKDNIILPTKENYNKLKKILDLDDRYDELINTTEAEREVIGKKESGCFNNQEKDKYTIGSSKALEIDITAPSTDLAKQWKGWGTCLKPSFEPIIIARKPFKGSLVDNVIKYGVGGINIDECRIAFNGDKWKNQKSGSTAKAFNLNEQQRQAGTGVLAGYECEANNNGRFPANTILTYDETDFNEVCGGFPNTKSGNITKEYKQDARFNIAEKGKGGNLDYSNCYGDSGSAARYFYCAKASKKDRDEGLEEFEQQKVNDGRKKDVNNAFQRGTTLRHNIHPTVKPTELMQYLVRLVTPKGGTILDPFMGSGSTGKAVMYENKERQANYSFIGIEKEKEYCDIARARIEWAKKQEEKEKQNQMQINEKGEIS